MSIGNWTRFRKTQVSIGIKGSHANQVKVASRRKSAGGDEICRVSPVK